MAKWIVTGRRHYSKAFEVEVEADTPHEASVKANAEIDSKAVFMPEKKEYTDIVIVKEKR